MTTPAIAAYQALVRQVADCETRDAVASVVAEGRTRLAADPARLRNLLDAAARRARGLSYRAVANTAAAATRSR